MHLKKVIPLVPIRTYGLIISLYNFQVFVRYQNNIIGELGQIFITLCQGTAFTLNFILPTVKSDLLVSPEISYSDASAGN